MFLRKLLVLSLFLLSVTTAFPQEGNIVTGKIYDDEGPLVMVNVLEVDNNNRIVAATQSDINGQFSLRIKNKADFIRVTYIGYKPKSVPIGDKKFFDIKMEMDNTLLQEAVVSATKVESYGGLAIPDREISSAIQSISAKEFEGLAISSIDEALQGRISGLDIVLNSGDLGAGTSMRLRGVSSINSSSEPLIVVDDQVWQSNETYDLTNATTEQFADLLAINPADIENIKILKDAASTAIWGSQGANGVIMITTKRGVKGPIKMDYSIRLNGSFQPSGYNMLDGDGYTMFLKESHYNPTQADAAADIIELNYDPNFSEYEQFNNNTDWIGAVKQMGIKMQNFFSLSGGGEKASMRMSVGYDTETGSIIGQKLDRLTLRTNLDYQVSSRIRFSSNTSFSYNDNKRNSDGLLSLAYQKMPNLAIYVQDEYGNDTDEYYKVRKDISPILSDQITVNPIASAAYAKNEQRSYNINPQFVLRYDLLGTTSDQTRLQYQGSVALNISYSDTEKFYPAILKSVDWNQGVNTSSLGQDKGIGFSTRHQLVLTPVFSNPSHSFSTMARIEINSSSSNSQSTSSYGNPSGGITSSTIDGYISNMSTGSGESRSVYATWSAHYSYMSKYSVSTSVRGDASTKFGTAHKWMVFPALSFRWNISDELWMEDFSDWLSMLSIRPGWGKTGKAPSGEYLHYSKYSVDGSYLESQGIRPVNIRLTDLRAETTTTYNLGTDLGLWKDRITANVDIYTQQKDDLLMKNRVIPSSTGYTSLVWKNVGSMLNQGWEFSINANRFVKFGDFYMDANVVFGNNYNSIIAMDENVLSTLNPEFTYKNGDYLSRVQCNNAFGSIYGFRHLGVYAYSDYIEGVQENAPVARDADGNVILDNKGHTVPMYFAYGTSSQYRFQGGDVIYEDMNHDGNINELDIVYLGNSNPILTGGFGLKLHYKQLSINAQFNYRLGNMVVNRARMNAENMYSHNNQLKSVNWRWRKEGDGANGERVMPRALYQSGYNWLASDYYVEKGDFLRLNYLQIAYVVPKGIAKAVAANRITVSATMNNLFCLTKYTGLDPEVGYGSWGVSADNNQTPRAKSFTLNLNVAF